MDYEQRIAELEDALKQRDVRIKELIVGQDAERALVAKMRQCTEDAHRMIEQWIEAFDVVLNEKGLCYWGESLMQKYNLLDNKQRALRKDWNKFVPEYDAVVASRTRNFGRSPATSNSQKADVIKRRRKGQSLRAIADETGLSLSTVRTITEKADWVDRAMLKRLQRMAPDKFAEVKERGRKATKSPTQIASAGPVTA